MATNEEMIQDIIDRFGALEGKIDTVAESVSPDAIRGMVDTSLGDLKDDHPFVRKMAFTGGDAEDALKGTVYGRLGWNASDVEFLHDLMGARAEAGKGKGPSETLRNAFDAVTVNTRAMDTAESGYGQQLVGAQYVADLWEASRPESRVFGLINTFEMSAPTAYLPVEVDVPEMLLGTEAAANNTANMATTKTGSNRVQVEAKKFFIHQMWSGEMEEDSIIPFVPFLRRQASISLAHYTDSAVLNGDTTATATGNINSDDAAPAAGKHYLGFDGLRHAALVDAASNSTNALIGASLATDDLMAAKGRLVDYTYLHDWGHPSNAADLVYVADPVTADKIASLTAVNDARIYNGGRDLLSGQVGDILGHPVISSIAMPLTEADGKKSATTPANNTKGTILVFNRRGFVAGWRRHVKLATEYLPATDQFRIVYTLRLGFGRFSPTGAASGIKSAGVIYNI